MEFNVGAIEILNHPFDVLAFDRSLQDRLSVILDQHLKCQSKLPESIKSIVALNEDGFGKTYD